MPLGQQDQGFPQEMEFRGLEAHMSRTTAQDQKSFRHMQLSRPLLSCTVKDVSVSEAAIENDTDLRCRTVI